MFNSEQHILADSAIESAFKSRTPFLALGAACSSALLLSGLLLRLPL
ncbi:MAG: hypothetical protein ACI805_001302 [Candidatus Azotimanducaceae bacterium]|jgi:hypothetical protein